MCGIAGLFGPHTSAGQRREATELMLHALIHRGPDDHDLWQDNTDGVTLGHRRLSILDLSPLGRQPMHGKNFSIVFNGEIYNFRALRQRLETDFHHGFRGHSDTEVLLAGFEYWGVEKTLAEINGMFAIALWDHRVKCLHLMRDRLGEKPLAYGLIDGMLAFASEVRAISRIPQFKSGLDPAAIAAMVQFNNIPAPMTIYKGIFKLEPGHLLTFTREHLRSATLPDAKAYWSCEEVFRQGIQNQFILPESELLTQLDQLLLDSTLMRMEADVPLGAFLSGGVDSSLTVAMMQAQSAKPIRTFTVGFADPRYNEAEFAKNIAAHLGTDHTELYVSDQQVLEAVPQMARVFDEPFSDSSQVPTFLISQLTRKHVTVVLSGDGGDELFAGYARYLAAQALWKKISPVPSGLRRALAQLLLMPSPQGWTAALDWLKIVLPAARRGSAIGFKIHKMAGLLGAQTADELYRLWISQWSGSDFPLAHSPVAPKVFAVPTDFTRDPIRRMMYLDCMHYLPDEILVKVDRAAMAVSLETRIPLLDHRVVEFSSRLPMHFLARAGRGKYLTRKLLEKYVPLQLFDRPKMGFNAPIQHWLRGPLKEWAEELLSEDRLKREGNFQPALVRNKWRQHLNGYDCAWELWSVLMFQAWLEESRQGVPTTGTQPRTLAL